MIPSYRQRFWLVPAIAALILAFCPAAGMAAGPEMTPSQSETQPNTGTVEPVIPPDHKGVIQPPNIGDEEIHTEVPNPEAGHEEEVIPPSELPEQQPAPQPR